MYTDIEIKALDHFGRGLSYINNKIVFIPNALIKERVDIKITTEKKKYSEARVVKYLNKSRNRINSICPYFGKCGGCHLLHMTYEGTIEFKSNKAKELIQKNKIDYNNKLEIIKSDKPCFYRNKVSLKIVEGSIGYYQEKTHDLVKIKECIVANPEINKVIENYQLLNIKNGSLVIRCNSNQEVLLVIKSKEANYDIELGRLKEIVKLVGIVYNDKTIYGENFFYERIYGMLFKVSYNSFFQVNPFITKKLFELLESNIEKNTSVLDLYSGVGTLSLVASKKAREVLSVEVIQNAVLNGIFNAKINKRNHIQFMLGDVSKIVEKIDKNFDTLIVDPPRSGLDKNTIMFIQNKKPKKIIYISCDVNTLMRDLKSLESLYQIKDYKILDMFSYSYHLESFVVLESK